MQIEESDRQDVAKRLRRIQGQLSGILKMLEEGRECEEVATQVAAAAKALNRTGFKVVSAGMQQCFAAEADGDTSDAKERLERLFLALA
jgi:DNA-binding FrmR family transcriptional regulator